MTRQMRSVWCVWLIATVICTGCTPQQPFFFHEDGDLSHYKGVATEIEYADVETDRLADVSEAMAPFSIKNYDPNNMEYWDVTLEEAMKTTLANSKVIRTIGGQVVQPPALLSQSPDSFPTVYDPAIAESNPRIGVEAALSAFDAQLASSVLWARNDRPVNVTGFVGDQIFARFFEQDLGQGIIELRKVTATGGTFFLRENTAYEYNNNPTRLFPSDWNQNVEAEFRHPLLQGAGVQFNRIAGPNAQPGFFFANGVILARINFDISLADFEIAVRNLARDVETAYWELYFAYRNLDALTAGRDSALQTWRRVYALYVVSAVGGEAEKEAQAREQYFLFRAQVENALSQLFATENRLRFLMGIASTDGRLIRPADEPSIARINLDWYEVHAEALARSTELRREKWRVKQREMELIATRNFLLPRLDATGRYRWLGWGDDWWFANRSNAQFSNAMQTLTTGRFEEWQFGLTFNMPIGFRQALAAVRNAQLLLARERAVLQDEELEISHQLADAVRNVDRYYGLAQTNFNRRVAAERNVDAVKAAYDTGTVTLDLVLDAQRRLADAENSYYRSLADYMLAIRDVHLRKGSLLEYNGVMLAEGPWPAKAYFDAMRRARERDAAHYIDYGFTLPRVMSRGKYQQFIHDGTGALQGTPVPAGNAPEQVPAPPAIQQQPPANAGPANLPGQFQPAVSPVLGMAREPLGAPARGMSGNAVLAGGAPVRNPSAGQSYEAVAGYTSGPTAPAAPSGARAQYQEPFPVLRR